MADALAVLTIYATTFLAVRFALRATRLLPFGIRIAILFGVLLAPGIVFGLLFGLGQPQY